MAIDTLMGVERECYEFMGDALPGEFVTNVNGTGAVVNINAATTGTPKSRRASCVNLVSGSVDSANAELALVPNMSAYNGKCSVQGRFLYAGGAAGAFAVGLYSQASAGNSVLPIVINSSDQLVGAGATTFVGFIFDSNSPHDEIVAAWRNNGANAARPMSELRTGLPLLLDTWYDFKVELTSASPRSQADGLAVATFDIQTEPRAASERFSEKKFPEVARIGTNLTPYAGIQARGGGAQRSLSLDYLMPEQSRGI